MKKLFALAAILGMFMFGVHQQTYAQKAEGDSTATVQTDDATATDDTAVTTE